MAERLTAFLSPLNSEILISQNIGLVMNSLNTSITPKFGTARPCNPRLFKIVSAFSSLSVKNQLPETAPAPAAYKVEFRSLEACKLGIARYPDFEYNAHGGTGTGTGIAAVVEDDDDLNDRISVRFDVGSLYIPPLTTATTRFLGLPLPPFLRIDIVPELFQGNIDRESGKVDLEFKAKFLFSAGSMYRAPPLVVETVLTTEESTGRMRGGRGERLDGERRCRLVGVATVGTIDDAFMNTFLGLPTECLANLNAVITYSTS